MIVPSMPRNGRQRIGSAFVALLCMTFAFAASADQPPATTGIRRNRRTRVQRAR